MHRNIEEVELTIFDTETTGLDAGNGDRIVEIAALRVRGEHISDRFETLVNPERPISPGAFAVNNISEEMVHNAPLIRDVLPCFLDFIKGTCLCSYNLPFDLGFLKSEMTAVGIGSLEGMPMIDILAMARTLLPTLQRHSLLFVASSLGICQRQEHRALSDVDITWQVFRKLKAILYSKGISDLGHSISLFGVDQQVLRDMTAQKVSKIQEAVDDALRLKIRYMSSVDGTVTERIVLPKEIRQQRSRSYMIGFCFLKNEERTFRIDNILEMEAVPQKL